MQKKGVPAYRLTNINRNSRISFHSITNKEVTAKIRNLKQTAKGWNHLFRKMLPGLS